MQNVAKKNGKLFILREKVETETGSQKRKKEYSH